MPASDAASPGSACGTVSRSIGGQALALDGAVFVDDSGRRARAWAGAAMVISLVAGIFLVVLVTGVLAPGAGPRLHLPAATAPLGGTGSVGTTPATATGSGRVR